MPGQGTDLQTAVKLVLVDVSKKMHSEFKGPGAVDRLAQLDAFLSTAQMAVDHLFDEASRMEGYRLS